MKIRRLRRCFASSLACFSISSLALIGIAIEMYFKRQFPTVLSIVSAGLFWIGLIGGVVCVIITSVLIKKKRRLAISKNMITHPKFPGIIRLSDEMPMIVIYGISVAGVILLLTDVIWKWLPGWFAVIILSIVYLSFSAHCVLDGRDYEIFRIIKEGKKNERA